MNTIENSLIYSGIGNKLRKISISIGENMRKTGNLLHNRTFQKFDEMFGKNVPFSPIAKKIYGLQENFSRFPMETLVHDWLGFLKGEPLYLPDNELVFRSNGVTIPDREMGEYVMKAFLKKDSPYLKFGKLDGLLDVNVTVDEQSARVSYFRKQKINPTGKMMMKCNFGMTIQLRKPLESFDPSIYNSRPWVDCDQDKNFYPKIKGVFEQHEKFCHVGDDENYIIKRAETEGESNARFVLNQSSHGNNNFFKFLKSWTFANPNNPNAQIIKTYQCKKPFQYSLAFWPDTPRHYSPLIEIDASEESFSNIRMIKSSDFAHCLTFVENLSSKKIQELAGYSSRVYRKFGCVTISFHIDNALSFDSDFEKARLSAVKCLNALDQVFKETETYLQNNLATEWQTFTEGCEIYMADGSEIPDLDKYGAMLVAQTISFDPQMYVEKKGELGKFANSRLLGEFYNG